MQPVVFTVFGTYGAAKTVVFSTQDVTDTDDVYQGTAWAAGDAKVSKDGGAEASSTNTPARITAFLHSVAFTATEMQCSELDCIIRDQTEPEVYEPVHIKVINRLTLGTLTVDATNVGGNTNAMTLTGVGTGVGLTSSGGASGHGAQFTGGATTGSGIAAASQTSGNGIAAVGAGSGHGFSGTAGGTGAICNFFDTVMTAEPTAAFASTDTYGKTLARLVRRFYNKVTQTSSQQKQYKDDSTTVLETMTVSDDATTQTKGKSS